MTARPISYRHSVALDSENSEQPSQSERFASGLLSPDEGNSWRKANVNAEDQKGREVDVNEDRQADLVIFQLKCHDSLDFANDPLERLEKCCDCQVGQ